MKVAVIDYKAGNVTSVLYALERLGAEAELTADSEKIRTADRVIFPGQGEASSAMRVLKETGIDKVIPELKQPFFGICLGLQLLCAHSEEKDTPCLGVFPVQVKRFRPENPKVDKVPQVGWNQLEKPNSPLLKGLPAAAYVYYVHSFYAELSPYTIAETTYTLPFSALMHRDNFYAMQAHPEKSGLVGQQILENFLRL